MDAWEAKLVGKRHRWRKTTKWRPEAEILRLQVLLQSRLWASFLRTAQSMSKIWTEQLSSDTKKSFVMTRDQTTAYPYALKAGWSDMPNLWPDTTFGDIYTCLIDMPGICTRESMRPSRWKPMHFLLEDMLKLCCIILLITTHHFVS